MRTLERETPIYNRLAFEILYEPGDPYMDCFWNSSFYDYPWEQRV
jgi:hypothetical protein